MKKFVGHWTGGGYQASEYERAHYHGLVEGDGRRVEGDKAPEANKSPLDANYVRHAGGFNSDAIGRAICCMGGDDVRESPLNTGKYPPTKAQWDELCKWAAEDCQTYGIKIDQDHVVLHAEIKSRWGRGVYKWDITVVPGHAGRLSAKTAGDIFRDQVRKEFDALGSTHIGSEPKASPFAALFAAIASIFGGKK